MKKAKKDERDYEKGESMLKKILIRILEILLLILLIGFLISIIGNGCNGCDDDDSKNGFFDKISDKLNEWVGLGDGKTLFDIELPFELNGIFDIFKGPSGDKVSDDKDGDGITDGTSGDTTDPENPGDTDPTDPENPGETDSETKYKITFVVDGAIYHTLTTPANAEVDMPENPVKEGFQFISWYFDEGVWEDVFEATMPTVEPLTKDITLYARFHELVGGEGDEGETGGEGGNTGTEEGGGNEGGSSEGGSNEGGSGEGSDPDSPGDNNPILPGGGEGDGDGDEGDGEGSGDGVGDGSDTDGDHTADTIDNSETIENDDGLTLDHEIDTEYLHDNKKITNESEDYNVEIDANDPNDDLEETEEGTFAIHISSERAIYGVSISFELTEPTLQGLTAYYYTAEGERVDLQVTDNDDNTYSIYVSNIVLGEKAVLEIYITSSDEANQSIKVTKLVINTDKEYPV